MTRGFFDLFSGELRDLNIENMSGVNTNLATEYTFIKELRRGKLVNVHVTGLQVDFTSGDEIISHAIGGLVNTLYGGTIEDSSISGNMNGIHHGAGGMVGKAREDRVSCDSTLQNCVSKVNMNTDAGRIVGGLVGSASYTNVTNSYSTGTVTGLTQVGGLIGSFGFGEIVGSSASGNVSGTISVGGLVGVLGNATLTTSGASGSVTSSGGDKAG